MNPANWEFQIWLNYVSYKTTLTGYYPIHDGAIFSDLSKLNQLSLEDLQNIKWATGEETTGYRATALKRKLDTEQRVKGLTEENNKLRQQTDQLNKKVEQVNELVERLQGTMKETTEEVEKLKEEKKQLEVQVERLQGIKKDTTEEVEKLKQDIVQLEGQVEHLQGVNAKYLKIEKMFRDASSSPAVLTTSKSGDNTNEVTDTDSIDEQGKTKRAKHSVGNEVDTSKAHYIGKYCSAFSPIVNKNNLMKHDLIPTPVNFDMPKDGLITQAEMELFTEDGLAWEDGIIEDE